MSLLLSVFEINLRAVAGNHPTRLFGAKFTALELVFQAGGLFLGAGEAFGLNLFRAPFLAASQFTPAHGPRY
jgi:hypothetical protein